MKCLVTAYYPEHPENPGSILGEIEGDNVADAYGNLGALLRNMAGGSYIFDDERSVPFALMALKNGVRLSIQAVPEQGLEHWIRLSGVISRRKAAKSA